LAKRGSRIPLHRVPPVILQRSRDLRHPLTPVEARLWQRLRGHQLGVHIRRQHVLLGRFIPDFYCADAGLCIEIDGDSHAEPAQAAYDAERSACLEAHGYRVIRFTNAEVVANLQSVLEAIEAACRSGR